MNPSTLVFLATIPQRPEAELYIWALFAPVIAAVVLIGACMLVGVWVGPNQYGEPWEKRNIAILAGSWGVAITIVAVLLLTVSIPMTINATRGNQERDDKWKENAARWAHDTYGVTAGMKDLELENWSSDENIGLTGTVIAQGKIADVRLRWVGEQAFLVMKGDPSNELPHVTTKQ